jgi:hypothetical protein
MSENDGGGIDFQTGSGKNGGHDGDMTFKARHIHFNEGEPAKIYEIAIVELDTNGRATGRFDIGNFVAPNLDTAKLRAFAASTVAQSLVIGGSIEVKVREF